jgi:hypothetical protein
LLVFGSWEHGRVVAAPQDGPPAAWSALIGSAWLFGVLFAACFAIRFALLIAAMPAALKAWQGRQQ